VYTQNAAANRWRERLLPGARAQEQQLGSFFPGTFVNVFAPAGREFAMSVHSGHWAFLRLSGARRLRVDFTRRSPAPGARRPPPPAAAQARTPSGKTSWSSR